MPTICTRDVSVCSDVEAHLGLKDLGYHSTYILALEEARFLSGRDIKMGAFNANHAYVGFLGLTGYLCLLDHIGGIYAPKVPRRSVRDPKNNQFKCALISFSDLDVDHINALYALRCSLAHNFSLVNTDRKKCYLFKLVRSDREELVIPAKSPWDGNLSTASLDNFRTTVNMLKVGDLVENIHRELIRLHEQSELMCTLRNPQAIELINRYSVLVKVVT